MKTAQRYDALIIGNGCAGFNAADCLFDAGVRNITILTESVQAGTSRNTGSDKQTYYKTSLAGNEGDSAYKLAETLFAGGSMDGDTALCEAANSVPAFMKLERLGVRFPRNEYGEFVGYKTDHDPFARASSVGPYTSKRMTEALERSVTEKGISIISGMLCISAAVDNGGVCGVLAVDCNDLQNDFGLTFVTSPVVVVATGGPSILYRDSVYPLSHTGFSSLLWRAGVAGANLSEWQYGLASVDFRWNVSGAYQQVLPRYISVDSAGNEREFLNEWYADPFDALKNVFLKGYEWPFDGKKADGSSRIDLLVHRETTERGNKVYMDFTREPSCLCSGDFSRLPAVAKEYLRNSGALVHSPIERLRIMNKGAISLYRDHGIDLQKAPLRIAVCAQHNNGGADVDADWQTSVRGVFVAGEAAGTLGVVRPGGTALNSCMVSGYRIAEAVAYGPVRACGDGKTKAEQEADGWRKLFCGAVGQTSTIQAYREKAQARMSAHFSFLRDISAMQDGVAAFDDDLAHFAERNKVRDIRELPELIKNYDMTVSQRVYARGMLYAALHAGSRGGALVSSGGVRVDEDITYRGKRILTRLKGDEVHSFERDVRPLPEGRELWFEKVWNAYNEKHKY